MECAVSVVDGRSLVTDIPRALPPMTATHLPLSLAVLLVALTGCKKDEEIRVYRVAKEGAAPVPQAPGPAADPHAGVPGADPHAGMKAGDPHAGLPMGGKPPAPGDPPAAKALIGKVPDEWQAGQSSTMRQASFAVKGEGGAVADISLVILRGAAGGLLDNVNRWRQQLGQAAVDEAGLNASAQRVATPVGEAVVVDVEGLPDGADPASDGRIVAAVIEKPQETWFYKLRGNAGLVGAQKQAFVDWIASVKQEELDRE